MGQFFPAMRMLDRRARTQFRLAVLAGCRKLDYQHLRQLADDIHACARARHDAELAAEGLGAQPSR